VARTNVVIDATSERYVADFILPSPLRMGRLKGDRPVDPEGKTELEIAAVLFRQGRDRKVRVRKVDPFAIGKAGLPE
jgi:hypothetical protein